MVGVALQLINEMSTRFKPEIFKDSYQVALNELIEKKSKGRKIVAPDRKSSEPGTGKIVDLMAALRKSVKGDTAKAPARKTRSKKAG
jgi:DNA end-binding protein Ku